MNLWRYFGISLFLLGALCFISTERLPVVAAQEKDSKIKVPAKDDKDKDGSKDKDKDGSKDKDKDAGKDKDAAKDKDKKADDKKPEIKPPPVTGGEKLKFSAFDPAGKPFYQVQNTETTQKMKVRGQEVIQKQDQTFLIKWTPKPADKDGNYVVEQQIEGVKMTIDIGGNKITYDSTAKNPKNPMTDFFEQLTKQKLTFTITPDLKVKLPIGGRDEFIKGLSDINPQMKKLLESILSDKALQKMAEPTWYAYPDSGTLAKDQTWKKESNLDLGPIGSYKTDFTFTYKGADGAKDKIGIKTSLTYSAPTEKVGLPFIIHKATLSSESGDGEAIFDRNKGRFDSTTIKMKLAGNLEIEVGNMRTTVELAQDQTAKSDTHDDVPAAWKAKQ